MTEDIQLEPIIAAQCRIVELIFVCVVSHPESIGPRADEGKLPATDECIDAPVYVCKILFASADRYLIQTAPSNALRRNLARISVEQPETLAIAQVGSAEQFVVGRNGSGGAATLVATSTRNTVDAATAAEGEPPGIVGRKRVRVRIEELERKPA